MGTHPAVDSTSDLRRVIVQALHAAGGGHFGGALSVVDILYVLYTRIMRVWPDAPDAPERDRLILSKGHAAVALYAVLASRNFFESERLASYARAGSGLEGHPDMTVTPGVDFSTGSLGQGLSAGVGMAIALRSSGPNVHVVLGDGECQEGQVWEAAMFASRARLDRLTVVVDLNHFQEFGWTGRDPVDDLAAKWSAFGWCVEHADGHSLDDLEGALRRAQDNEGSPTVVLAETVKGRGFPYIEAEPARFHCTTLSDDEYAGLVATVA